MKCKELILLFLFCWPLGIKAASLHDYGLYFNSYHVPVNERTTLSLEDGKPYPVKDNLVISFYMLVRDREPDFGSILHLTTNENQVIHFSLMAADGHLNYPALVFDDGMAFVKQPIERGKWMPVSLKLNVRHNKIDLHFGGKDTTLVVPLRGIENVKVQFGRVDGYIQDVAPMNIRDVRVSLDGEEIRHWMLWKHNKGICYDERAGVAAQAECPFWLIDNHIEWRQIYADKITGRFDVAFNARDALFYFVHPDKVEVFDGDKGIVHTMPVRGGYLAMEFSNHLMYDTLSNSLLSYSLSQGNVSRFSFDTHVWSAGESNKSEPYYFNHARTFNAVDSSFYFFGGYGYYRYRSDLFCWKSGSDVVQKVAYELALEPRYSAAATVVGDDLYIFGGRGNKVGKQGVDAYYYYDLSMIDLKTKQSRQVWKSQRPQQEMMLMASSMYFDPTDSSFYAVSMAGGGKLLKISLADSVWTAVSRPIYNEIVYQDCDLGFYYSPLHSKFYLVIDKIVSDQTHDVAIYSINRPLVSELDILQAAAEESSSWYGYVVAVLILLIGAALVFRYRRKMQSEQSVLSVTKAGELTQFPAEEKISRSKVAEEELQPVEKYFDRSRSAISLLGTFNVRDKDGNDMAASFTPRLKDLLILLVLYTEKSEQGILTKKATDLLWFDKEEGAARNNRNVTLRKLRVLLESVGDVEIVSNNGFLCINWGKDVFCDYRAVLAYIRQFNKKGEEPNRELLNRILEILLYGPLLSNTVVDWLDEFKDTYSSLSIDLLKSLLDIEYRQNHQETVLRIADIMLLHDPLNEEALAAKCAVLSAQGKKGIAKSVYDRFCREYKDSLGEKYKVPFSDLEYS